MGGWVGGCVCVCVCVFRARYPTVIICDKDARAGPKYSFTSPGPGTTPAACPPSSRELSPMPRP